MLARPTAALEVEGSDVSLEHRSDRCQSDSVAERSVHHEVLVKENLSVLLLVVAPDADRPSLSACPRGRVLE